MQELAKETAEALSRLYGGNPDRPVCAASEKMTLLWRSSERAEALFYALMGQLPGLSTPPKPLIPSDQSIILTSVYPPVLCQVQMLFVQPEPLYLLLFSAMPSRRCADLPEVRALMRQHIEVSDRSVSEMLSALGRMESAPDAEPSAEHRIIRNACISILHQLFCEEELLWYELPDENAPELMRPVCVSDLLREFLAGIKGRVSTAFQTDAKIEENLYARIEPNRLLFVLLSLFSEAQQGDPARTQFSLTAEQDSSGSIRILLRFRRRTPDAGNAPFFRPYTETDSSVLNEQYLRTCFCKLFGAAISPVQDGDADGFLLVLPGDASLPETLTFRASVPPVPNGIDSKFAVMLSRVLDTESLKEHQSEHW